MAPRRALRRRSTTPSGTSGSTCQSSRTPSRQRGSPPRGRSEFAQPSPISYRDDEEEVPRVQRSKARQNRLARQCSGHGALPADCKFPWQPKMGRLRLQRSWSSDSPIGVAHAPATVPLATRLFHASTEMLRECCRLGTGQPAIPCAARSPDRGIARETQAGKLDNNARQRALIPVSFARCAQNRPCLPRPMRFGL
jgi:hypothetical protein